MLCVSLSYDEPFLRKLINFYLSSMESGGYVTLIWVKFSHLITCSADPAYHVIEFHSVVLEMKLVSGHMEKQTNTTSAYVHEIWCNTVSWVITTVWRTCIITYKDLNHVCSLCVGVTEKLLFPIPHILWESNFLGTWHSLIVTQLFKKSSVIVGLYHHHECSS